MQQSPGQSCGHVIKAADDGTCLDFECLCPRLQERGVVHVRQPVRARHATWRGDGVSDVQAEPGVYPRCAAAELGPPAGEAPWAGQQAGHAEHIGVPAVEVVCQRHHRLGRGKRKRNRVWRRLHGSRDNLPALILNPEPAVGRGVWALQRLARAGQ